MILCNRALGWQLQRSLRPRKCIGFHFSSSEC